MPVEMDHFERYMGQLEADAERLERQWNKGNTNVLPPNSDVDPYVRFRLMEEAEESTTV